MRPDVKKHLSLSEFLKEIYLFRKTLNHRFSYATWASELGIKNKAYLRLMILGMRHVNEGILKALVQNLELNELDSEYFLLLAAYSQSKASTEKNVLGKKMMGLLRADPEQKEVVAFYDFLSNPLLPKLHTLLSFSDIKKTPANLARLLMKTEDEISTGLAELERLGLVEPAGSEYVAKTKAFKVKDRYHDKGLHAFYSNIFEEAKEAIHLPSTERRFRSLFFAMKPEEVQDFIARLDSFAQEQLTNYNFDELEDRRLFQVHFNFFPITQQVLE